MKFSDPSRYESPATRYAADLRRPEFTPDHAQSSAVEQLDALFHSLVARHNLLRSMGQKLKNLFKPSLGREPVTGLYMWGGVGRGKTYLMDCFFSSLPFESKLRLHFHRFMKQVHEHLTDLKHQQDPLEIVAHNFSKKYEVICFDEFFVSDIADAMLLGTLFEYLFSFGVTLVATSNVEPDRLYHDGLQRARFLPAIDLIKQYTQVINVDGGTDYRLRVLERADIYHHPLDIESNSNLVYSFEHIAGQWDENQSIRIENRDIDTLRLAEGIAWFDFKSICDGPRSQADYIELAHLFHTVLVSGIPELDETTGNAVRRFISLVDEFYDRAVKLMISAEVPLENLYRGTKLEFEFKRTRSRLLEMQSHEYLAREHRP